MTRPAVAVAASAGFAELDGNWLALRDALAGVGLAAEVVPWDGPIQDWRAYAAVVPLYCWGYVTHREEFLHWARSVAATTTLINPAPTVEWGTDKRYLAELLAGGLPVIPTVLVENGAPWEPPAAVDFVVKPSIGSGGLGAARYGATPREHAAARRHVDRLRAAGADSAAVVQPYQEAVDTDGETGVVVVEGRVTHAATKGPLLERGAGEVEGLWEHERITPTAATPAQRRLAERAVAWVEANVGGPITYARVDLVPGPSGAPTILEVELIEPTLWLTGQPAAAAHLAAAIRRRISTPG